MKHTAHRSALEKRRCAKLFRTGSVSVASGFAALVCCLWMLAWPGTLSSQRVLPSASSAAAWPTLRLDGRSGMELPSDLFTNLHDATVEAWVQWAHFSSWQRFFSYGTIGRDAYIGVERSSRDLQFVVRNMAQSYQPIDVGGVLVEGEWCHIAAVSGPGGMRLYVNGNEVASSDVTNTLAALPPGSGWIGRWTDANSGFEGSVAEFRIWARARTPEEIRADMKRQLTGREPGLAALWNFADTNQPGRDATTNGHHGQMFGSARVAWEMVGEGRLNSRAVLTGTVTDQSGQPVPNAVVTLLRDGVQRARTRTGSQGNYRFIVSTSEEEEELRAEFGSEQASRKGLILKSGEQPRLDLQLWRPATLTGKITDPGGSPLAGVMVELVARQATADNPQVLSELAETKLALAFTSGDGVYHFRHVEPGQYVVRARTTNGPVPFRDGKPVTLVSGTHFAGADLRLPARPRSQVSNLKSQVPNRVMQFKGSGDSVSLPAGFLSELDEATIECWVKWDQLRPFANAWSFGKLPYALGLHPLAVSNDLAVVFDRGPNSAERLVAAGVLAPGRWVHVAVGFEGADVTLHVNGILMAALHGQPPFQNLFSGGQFLGHGSAISGAPFQGQLDEVRVWSVKRSTRQIGEGMFTRMTGEEDGLVALWNFDSTAGPGLDATTHGLHATLLGNVAAASVAPPAPIDIVVPTVISGVVTDPDGRAVPKADVRLTRDGERVAGMFSDFAGNFLLTVPPSDRPATLLGRLDDLSCPPINLVLRPGDNRVDVALRDSAAISGKVLALDDTALPNVVVQAVRAVAGGGVQPGLMGEFFEVKDPREFPVINGPPSFWRVDEQVNFPLANGGISGGKIGTGLYARWSGKLRVAQVGVHRFHLAGNDRARLIIDGQEVVDATSPLTGSTPLAASEKSAEIELTAGEHDITIELINRIGREGCALAWTPPGSAKQIIPARAFAHLPPESEMLSAAMSDARGVYRFPELASGDYQLRVQVPGGFVLLNDDRPFTAKRGEPLARLDFQIAPFKKGVWRRYNFNDGLANDTVNYVHRAPDGAMWFGTEGGASRFDGLRFHTWAKAEGLAGNNVRSILAESNGVTWFGTLDALTRHDPHASQPFVTFTETNGLPGRRVKALLRDRCGTLWVSCDEGLARFDGTNFVSVLRRERPTEHGLGLIEDAQGVVWWGDQGVWRVSGEKPERVDASGLVRLGEIISLCEGEPGVIWLGAHEGLARYETKRTTNAVTLFTSREGLISGAIVSLHRDRRGRIWAGSYGAGSGLSCFDGGSFINYRHTDGLPNENVMAIGDDADGALWFATHRGVATLDTEGLTQWSVKDGLDSGFVEHIASTSDGSVWFLTGKKLSRFDGKTFSKITQAGGLPGAAPASLFVDKDGALLVSDTAAAVARWQPTAGVAPKFEIMEGTFPAQALARSASGDLWFGNTRGVWRYGESGPSGNSAIGGVWCIEAAPNGAMWFQLAANGVACFDGTNFLKFPLRGGDAWSLLAAPDGNVFSSTRLGPHRFDGEHFHAFPKDNPRLARLSVNSIAQRRGGLLHIASYEGLFSSDGTAFTTLDERDGLPNSTVRGVHETADGTLWLTLDGDAGLVRHRPAHRAPKAPTVTVQTDRNYTDLAALPKLFTGQRVTFKFDAVDFRTVPAKRQYRWQLFRGTHDQAGLQANWLAADTATQLEKAFDLPGAWTLAVQYIDRDLNYSLPTLALIQVALPWHANMAIMVPACTGVAGLLGWAFVARVLVVRRKREAERLREQVLDEERKAREAAERNERVLAGELAEAAAYVRSLLPAPQRHQPVCADWRFQPSAQLGGDALGFHWLGTEHFAFYVLDVCGHGVGAALLSVSVMSVLRNRSMPGVDFADPGAVLGALNRTFVMEEHNNMFFTIWYGVYSPGTRELAYACGGHPPAVLLAPGAVAPHPLPGAGAIVGGFPESTYATARVSLPPGARLCVFSDGVYELKRADGSTVPLSEFIAQLGRATMTLDDILDWAGRVRSGEKFEDDVSLLEVRLA